MAKPDPKICNYCGGEILANVVHTHRIKPEPTPQASPPPAVRCSEWVDALAENWERRLANLRMIVGDSDDAITGMIFQLQECLEELRAEIESASTDGC